MSSVRNCLYVLIELGDSSFSRGSDVFYFKFWFCFIRTDIGTYRLDLHVSKAE